MRAVLLASATGTTLGGRRSASRTTHASGALALVSIERASCISGVHRYLSPRLEMPSCGAVHRCPPAGAPGQARRRHYNASRPHSGLGYRSPAPEAIIPSN